MSIFIMNRGLLLLFMIFILVSSGFYLIGYFGNGFNGKVVFEDNFDDDDIECIDFQYPITASVYDENNEAVKELVRQTIKVAREKGVKVGICGQAPSDSPEFAAFLVKEGIDSISLSPDTVVKTMIATNTLEANRT
mgnify:CR=1 FL=1